MSSPLLLTSHVYSLPVNCISYVAFPCITAWGGKLDGKQVHRLLMKNSNSIYDITHVWLTFQQRPRRTSSREGLMMSLFKYDGWLLRKSFWRQNIFWTIFNEVEFIYNNIHQFQVYNSMSIFMYIQSYKPSPQSKYRTFQHHKIFLQCSFQSTPCSHTRNQWSAFCHCSLPFVGFHKISIIWYTIFCVQFTSLKICVVACISSLFIFMTR